MNTNKNICRSSNMQDSNEDFKEDKKVFYVQKL